MHLTIVYDETCPFCCWCRDWVAGQDLLVPVTLRPRSDGFARDRWGHLPGYGQEVFAADDRGHVWTGPPAFVMVLWATRAHRHRSYDLTGPTARAMFGWLSRQRRHLSGVVAGRAIDAPVTGAEAGPVTCCGPDSRHPEDPCQPPQADPRGPHANACSMPP